MIKHFSDSTLFAKSRAVNIQGAVNVTWSNATNTNLGEPGFHYESMHGTKQ